METHRRELLNHLVSSDDAPDTGDDSDEDLVTNYLGNGANSGANNDSLVPTIHITPQSPNGNHVLEDNLLQLAQIQERIQEMRMSNAQANLNVTSTNSKGRLSTSCPSLNESSDAAVVLDDNTSNTTDNSNHHDRNRNRQSRSKIDNNANSKHRKMRPQQQQGRHRSVSVSSGDSDDDETDTVDGSASQKIRQRSSSTAPKEASGTNATPPPFKESRFFHGRHKSPHLMAQFPSLHKSVSTPSIVIDQNHSGSGEKSGKKKHHHRDLPEPTHVFLQRLIAEHEWTRPSGSDSDSEDEAGHHGGHQATAVRSVSAVGHPNSTVANLGPAARVRPHPLATQINSTPSPQLSLAEFLQDDPAEDDDSRKRRRKKERSSLFFRKKKDKGALGQNSNSAGSNGKPPSIQHHALFDPQQKGLAKVSSSINLGGNVRGSSSGSKDQGQASKMSQHSHSMSSLRKASISAPSQTLPMTVQSMGNNANFYLAKTDFGKSYDDNELGHEDTAGLLESEYIPGEEFTEGGGPAAIRDLETPRHLKIEEDEPETWTQTVSPSTISQLSNVDIKRQEHIYEFILTESNHCQVLKVIQKIFVEGMFKYLSLPKDIVDRIFPCIDTLIELHFKFLEELRARQNQNPVVETIADILHSQFSGETGNKWREAYGIFCSCHNDAVSVFKDLMKSDSRFRQFVMQCSENPLLKKKGVPECILFVTTRITKYPLLIEPLSKAATRDRPKDLELLKQANFFVKEILKDVNARVAEKERKQRLYEIYHKVDPKSTLSQSGKKFKKSDIVANDRKLMFEGVATIQQSRNRSLQVNVVLLSDILIFLHENNQKLYFIAPEGKPSIVPVKTLIARERSGGSSKSLNLLSIESFEQEPEVFELEIMQPPTRDDWITGIRDAVDAATPSSDSDAENEFNRRDRKAVENKCLRLRLLTADLRNKDIELSRVLESKMRIMNEILEIAQGDQVETVPKPDYISLVREKKNPGQESEVSKEQLLAAVQEASRLASSIYSSVTNLSRSVSSAGEKHSNVYSSPSLPRRAETFSGFDKEQANQKPKIKEIDISDGGEREIVSQITETANKSEKLPGPQPLLMSLEPEQQQAAVQLTHYMNSLMCMVAEHFTSLESVKAELSEIREKANISGGRYKQNQRFEEMRHLQETLAQEKKEWSAKREAIDQEVEAKKAEMHKYQAEIDRGLKDVKEQREQLYRKLEVLRAQGIELGPNLSVLKNDPAIMPGKASPGEHLLYKELSSVSPNLPVQSSASSIRKSSSLTSSSSAIMTPANNILTGGSLKKESLANLHLLSATNESKTLLDKQEIKQQIPVKLSSLSKDLSKMSKKSTASTSVLTSASSMSSLAVGNSGSGSSKGISNLAVKPETVQQLLPFKLSEDSNKVSPKHSSRYPAQQYYHQFDPPTSMSKRSTSPPHQQQVVYPHNQQHGAHGGSLRYSSSNNTLPKSTANVQKVTNYGGNSNTGAGGGSSGANSDDDKVIYF